LFGFLPFSLLDNMPWGVLLAHRLKWHIVQQRERQEPKERNQSTWLALDPLCHPRYAPCYCVEIVKFTVMRAAVSTGSPDCRCGRKRHCFTAWRAAPERMSGPLTTCSA